LLPLAIVGSIDGDSASIVRFEHPMMHSSDKNIIVAAFFIGIERRHLRQLKVVRNMTLLIASVDT
tara:strand:+ start:902 stop:1096 length:195 start_codon:yes stop_codon:yes gene_type:complete